MEAVRCSCQDWIQNGVELCIGGSKCLGFGWLWSDGRPPVLCPATEPGAAHQPWEVPCGRRNQTCPGCGREAKIIGHDIDIECSRRRREGHLLSTSRTTMDPPETAPAPATPRRQRRSRTIPGRLTSAELVQNPAEPVRGHHTDTLILDDPWNAVEVNDPAGYRPTQYFLTPQQADAMRSMSYEIQIQGSPVVQGRWTASEGRLSGLVDRTVTFTGESDGPGVDSET